MTKICPICGKEFEANHANTKYCSDPCREKANEINRYKYYEKHYIEVNCKSLEYYYEHAEEIKARCREQYKSRRTPVVKTCPICKREFVTHKSNRKYCSGECAEAARRGYDKYLYDYETVPLECQAEGRTDCLKCDLKRCIYD